MTYQRILVPLDGTKAAERILRYVRPIANGIHARIDILVCLPDTTMTAQQVAQLHKSATRYADQMSTDLATSGLNATGIVAIGDPATLILEKASQSKQTLVAISSRSRTSTLPWALEAVTDRVLHTAKNDLLIMHTGPESKARGTSPANLTNIVVPLDGSSLSEKALGAAVSLSLALNLKLVITRVSPHVAQPFESAPDAAIPHHVFALESEEAAKAYLEQAVDKLNQGNLKSVKHHHLHGQPAVELVNYLNRKRGTIVVMSTHGRSGVKRWFLGSVTDQVIFHSNQPVLVVRS